MLTAEGLFVPNARCVASLHAHSPVGHSDPPALRRVLTASMDIKNLRRAPMCDAPPGSEQSSVVSCAVLMRTSLGKSQKGATGRAAVAGPVPVI
jgi:hypothetical protein